MGMWQISCGSAGKGTIHFLGGTEWGIVRFSRDTQHSEQAKIYALFISGIFNLNLLDRGGPWVTETLKSEPGDTGELLCFMVPKMPSSFMLSCTFSIIAQRAFLNARSRFKKF